MGINFLAWVHLWLFLSFLSQSQVIIFSPWKILNLRLYLHSQSPTLSPPHLLPAAVKLQCASASPGGLITHRRLDLIPRVLDSLSLRWGWIICISNKFPEEAATLRERWGYTLRTTGCLMHSLPVYLQIFTRLNFPS